jgi:hypothetical protein
MAAESIALSASLQGAYQSGLVALKSAAQSEAAAVSLVTQAVQQGKTASAPPTDPSRALDIVV